MNIEITTKNNRKLCLLIDWLPIKFGKITFGCTKLGEVSIISWLLTENYEIQSHELFYYKFSNIFFCNQVKLKNFLWENKWKLIILNELMCKTWIQDKRASLFHPKFFLRWELKEVNFRHQIIHQETEMNLLGIG